MVPQQFDYEAHLHTRWSLQKKIGIIDLCIHGQSWIRKAKRTKRKRKLYQWSHLAIKRTLQFGTGIWCFLLFFKYLHSFLCGPLDQSSFWQAGLQYFRVLQPAHRLRGLFLLVLLAGFRHQLQTIGIILSRTARAKGSFSMTTSPGL